MDYDYELMLYGQKRTQPTSFDWTELPKPDFQPFGEYRQSGG